MNMVDSKLYSTINRKKLIMKIEMITDDTPFWIIDRI